MQKYIVTLCMILLAVTTIEIFFVEGKFPALSIFLGFFSSLFLMGFAKTLGKTCLYVDEDYYDSV